ncbi:MAG: hypothetical protein AVDCRST_MAG71-782, partial [uncultured Lysobacter sp.]
GTDQPDLGPCRTCVDGGRIDPVAGLGQLVPDPVRGGRCGDRGDRHRDHAARTAWPREDRPGAQRHRDHRRRRAPGNRRRRAL